MKMKTTPNGRSTVGMLALAAAALTTFAYADGPRRVGYSESLVQDGKAPYTASGTVDLKRGPANAAMLAAALARMPAATTTAVNIDGSVQPVILRRSFPAGDAGATGKTDILFSLQPCRKVERDPQDQNALACRDQPAAAPQFALAKLVLAPGQSATVSFSGGITWTYQVRDADAD